MGSTGRRRRGRPGGGGHRGRQIFVDASGRRRKAVRYGMAAAGLVFAGYVVVLIAGFFGTGPADDQVPWVQGKPEPKATSERPKAPKPSATRPPAESDPARTPSPSVTPSESSSASPEASRSSSRPPADDTASATPDDPAPGASRGSGQGNGGNGTEPPGHGR
ncbi:hypothetical protein G5C51_07650 [Streptomyces sp. A7024]|uniref:Uncharacterized protein n=1 Tax=Streptomyces coryli TaxID=1128680 RepID=A0A6G4TXQ2_9ACTN|nr:hypothetical protein [Streptomyces coryli]NGN63781.1 hypothetical protein [Streptomyces coryli]